MKRKNIILVIIITISMILLSSILFIVISNHYKNLNNNEDTEIKEENNNQNDENIKEEDSDIENVQNNNNSNDNLWQDENISIMPIQNGKTIKFYKMVAGYTHVDNYKNEKEISSYTCISGNCSYCSSYTMCSAVHELENQLIALFEGEELIIFNAIEGKEISRYNDIVSAYQLSSSHNGKGKYLVLKNKDNQTAIVDLNGNYVKKYSDKKYVLLSYEGQWIDGSSYLVENNMIVTIQNNKYGLEKITNNDIIIEHQYEDIQLSDSNSVRLYADENDGMGEDNYMLYQNKYIKVKENGKWYLYDLKNNKKVNNHRYDKIYLIDENTLLVMEDKYIYLKDYNNNLLTNEKIYVENLFPSWPKVIEGIRITKVGYNCTITVVDGTDVGNQKYYEYSYNIETKELKKVTGE